MSFGLATPSPSASAAQIFQELGMNCIGPTARSQVGSPSRAPPSVSAIAATPLPFSTGPRIGAVVTPAAVTRPPRACPDSTIPIAATVCQLMRHAGSLVAISSAARRYAVSTRAGISLAPTPPAATVSPEPPRIVVCPLPVGAGRRSATGTAVGATGGTAGAAGGTGGAATTPSRPPLSPIDLPGPPVAGVPAEAAACAEPGFAVDATGVATAVTTAAAAIRAATRGIRRACIARIPPSSSLCGPIVGVPAPGAAVRATLTRPSGRGR